MRNESIKILADLAVWAEGSLKNVGERNFIKTEIQRVFNIEMLRPETKGKRVKFDIYKFVSNEKNTRPIMTGVYHDGGYQVASDSHVLACVKNDYPETMEGKVLSKTGEILNKEEPGYTTPRYPDYKSIKPDITKGTHEKITFTEDDFRAIREFLKACKIEKKLNPIVNELLCINHKAVFKAELFASMVASFMETFGSMDFWYSATGRAAITECVAGWCLMMPLYYKDANTWTEETFNEQHPELRCMFIDR